MIVCNNCGASYEDDEPRCPYCGGDNFGRSVQMHEDAVNELKREKRQWEEKPQRMAKTGMSLTAKILIVAIVAAGNAGKTGEDVSAAGLQWNLHISGKA